MRLRTTPAGNPKVWEEKRFRGMDKRGVYYYGISALRAGPLVVPGTYTVQLSADGKDFTQKLVVKKDPNSAGTEADVAASTKLSVQIWRDTSATARMINRIEWTRRQIEDFQKMLKAARAPAADVDAATDIEKKARAVEDDLLQPTLAEADLKSFRGPLKLYLSLLWLQAEVGPGAADVSGNADLAAHAARARCLRPARRAALRDPEELRGAVRESNPRLQRGDARKGIRPADDREGARGSSPRRREGGRRRRRGGAG